MSTRQSVPRHKLTPPLFCSALSWPVRLYVFVFLLIVGNLPTALAHADETIICAVTVNQQAQGEFFVIKRDDGDFLILPDDLRQMRIAKVSEQRIVFEGDAYVSLRGMGDIAFSFDELNLILDITASPQLLEKNSFDLRYKRTTNVYYPSETSLFINYGVDYTSSGESSLEFEGLNVSSELGFRLGDGLFLSDALYTDTPEDDRLVRLNTRVVWDWRDQMRRFTAGDFIADSGSLGSRVYLGGVSFAKTYELNPYFIDYPLFDFSGMLQVPADVELYVDGKKMRSERFAPGEFELLNYEGIRGAQTVEIVIRDAFGREQRMLMPIYSTDQILRRGLHEYSYNLGFPRHDFATKSNDYDQHPAFSAFHRYGVTDQINLGLRGELNEDLSNGGGEVAIVAGRFGLIRIEGAVSRHQKKVGAAGQFTYEYQTPLFTARLGVQSYSSWYRTLGDLESPSDRKLNLFASASYLTANHGSFGIRYAEAQRFEETDRHEVTLSWSRHLLGRAYLSSSVSLVDEENREVTALINLNWHFGQDRTLTAGYQHDDTTDTQSLEARQNTPSGYGTGWSIAAEHADGDLGETERLDGYLQHNAKHAILRVDGALDHNEADTTSTVRLALGGAVVFLGKTFGLTRPVRDSFSLVSIGNAESVRVYVNGQENGTTDHDGQLFVPDLSSYYENRISFESKDIPLDYLMPQVQLSVSPPLRGGACINFPLKRYQAFSGTLLIGTNGATAPLANAELTLKSPAGFVVFWTGSAGEFYLDSQMNDLDILAIQGCDAADHSAATFLPAGTYPITVKHAGTTFQAELEIPATAETFTELGTINLRPQPSDLTAPASSR